MKLIIEVICLLLLLLLASKVHACGTQTLKIAVPFIAHEEGERQTAYLDNAGVPTICFGSTRGVHLGMKKTHRQCLSLLRKEVAEYCDGLHRYLHDGLTPYRDAAYVSLAFNAGIYAIGHSTAVKRLNAGDIIGGCIAITQWNKAKGRVIPSLTERRQREYNLCMIGL